MQDAAERKARKNMVDNFHREIVKQRRRTDLEAFQNFMAPWAERDCDKAESEAKAFADKLHIKQKIQN